MIHKISTAKSQWWIFWWTETNRIPCCKSFKVNWKKRYLTNLGKAPNFAASFKFCNRFFSCFSILFFLFSFLLAKGSSSGSAKCLHHSLLTCHTYSSAYCTKVPLEKCELHVYTHEKDGNVQISHKIIITSAKRGLHNIMIWNNFIQIITCKNLHIQNNNVPQNSKFLFQIPNSKITCSWKPTRPTICYD